MEGMYGFLVWFGVFFGYEMLVLRCQSVVVVECDVVVCMVQCIVGEFVDERFVFWCLYVYLVCFFCVVQLNQCFVGVVGFVFGDVVVICLCNKNFGVDEWIVCFVVDFEEVVWFVKGELFEDVGEMSFMIGEVNFGEGFDFILLIVVVVVVDCVFVGLLFGFVIVVGVVVVVVGKVDVCFDVFVFFLC